jgi:hypothetical protein
MALSPNYGWAEPDNSSLVKNGAQDIRALGDAIDTSVWNIGFGQAGKNKIINGDFGIWQRGTTFSNPASLAYTADRFAIFYDGTGATRTISQQTFTPGAAPVAGYEGKFFYRYAVSVAGTSNTANLLRQYIEDVRTFAGNTVTVSFWAKAAANLTVGKIDFTQNFGTGGSPSAGVDTTVATSIAVTTSWQRFTYSVAVPSISGKTLGTNNDSALELRFFLPSNSAFTFDIWGVQVEYGSKATPFETATGTLQGELAACQRYYVRFNGDGNNAPTLPGGFVFGATGANVTSRFPVFMRVVPTSIDTGGSNSIVDASNTVFTATAYSLVNASKSVGSVDVTISGATAGRWCYLRSNNSGDNYIGFSAEL